jgi:hypothetical protein
MCWGLRVFGGVEGEEKGVDAAEFMTYSHL